MSAWCRSCGASQDGTARNCSACGVGMATDPPPPSSLGLVYEVRGKLGIGHRLGVCVDEDADSLVLHVSAKDKEPMRLPREARPTMDVPAQLGAATRLLYAAGLTEPKAWDRDLLRRKVAELCADVRVLRGLLDEALELGWREVADWVPLTSSERAWRMAHHASAKGDISSLRTALLALPAQGYSERAALLLPHLAVMRQDCQAWRAVVDPMVAGGAEKADLVRRLTFEPWRDSLNAGAALLPASPAAEWVSVIGQLDAGDAVPAPSSPGYRAWAAVSLLTAPNRGRLDAALDQIVDLEPALLDDLIDEGRLTAAASLADVKAPARTHLLSRLAPHELADEELATLGHVSELARRHFLRRNRSALDGLPALPRVRYYQALLDLVEGERADPERLDADAVELLTALEEDLARFRDGYSGSLSDVVASDPSLWPMFTDLAVSGKLPSDSGRSAGDPLNVWIGLNRLLGLVWEGSGEAALEHGRRLLPHLTEERQADEALSILSFVLSRLGRVDEALANLDKALKGSYTENLLVNASVIAAMARPEVAVGLLARLVDEAPSAELQNAALSRAIEVWESSDLPFPQVLIPALRAVMSAALPIDDYLMYSNVVINVAPDMVASLPDPGGELSGPYAILRARSRFKLESDFFLVDLADELIKVYRAVGRTPWFDRIWGAWVSDVHDAVFVDFGEALGSAEFIDKVLVDAPELLTQEQRFILAPQAGAHLNYMYTHKRDSWLNDRAWTKFFFAPIDEFLAARTGLDRNEADRLASNFTLCIGNATLNMIQVVRNTSAAEYNPLADRLRWDTENFAAIRSQMRRLLEETEQGPLRIVEAAVARMRKLGSTGRDELTRAVAEEVSDWREETNKLKRNL